MERAAISTCPTCKKTGEWLAGNYGLFCSHRCKLIDLGKWLGGEHVISEPLRPEHLEKYADLPAGEYLDKPEPELDAKHSTFKIRPRTPNNRPPSAREWLDVGS